MSVSWEGPAAGRRRRAMAIGVVALVGLVALAVASRPDPTGSAADLQVGVAEQATASAGADASAIEPSRNAEQSPPIEQPTTVSSSAPLGPTRRHSRAAAGFPTLTLVVADAFSRLHVIDIVTGDTTAIQVLAQPSRTRPRALWTLRGGVILDTVGDVVRLAGDAQRPTLLAGDHRSVPTSGASSLWVYDGVDFTGRDAGTGGTASRITRDGDVLDRVTLPALAQPMAATPDSLVLRTPGAVRLVGANGRTRRTVPGWGLASDGIRLARLACDDGLACNVVIGTFDDPDQVRTPLAPADLPADLSESPQSRFSPDGRWLALTIHRTRRTGLTDSSRVSIIEVATGDEVLRVRGSPLTEPQTPFAWSPDGRWLALSTGSGVRMWDAERGEVTDLDVRVPPTYALAVR